MKKQQKKLNRDSYKIWLVIHLKLAGATLIYSVLIDFVVEEFHRLGIIVALLQGVKSKFELLLAFQ